MMDKIIEYFKAGTENLNENKYFIGFAMILLNIGARFIIDELDDNLRQFVSQSFVRRFFIFCSFFLATRDILVAIVLTIVFIIIVTEFAEEKKDEGGDENGSSHNKEELEKTIQKLKEIQSTM